MGEVLVSKVKKWDATGGGRQTSTATKDVMRIRNATSDDAGELARVHIDSWLAAYRGLVPDSVLERLDYARREDSFRTSLLENSEETYVAEVGTEVVGFITVGPCRDDDVDKHETGEIWGIYLTPSYWRRGVGSQLCKYGEDILRSRGYVLAVLWVFGDNLQARRFYEAMGFEADGATKSRNLGVLLEVVRYRKGLRRV